MIGLAKVLGHAAGIRFAPDNHVVPVLRLGQYKRLEGPGFFRVTPGLEEVLRPISTHLLKPKTWVMMQFLQVNWV